MQIIRFGFLTGGKGPICAERIPATIELSADPHKTKCLVLGPDGDRKEEVPVIKNEKGGSEIVIKPECKTVWYEIDIE